MKRRFPVGSLPMYIFTLLFVLLPLCFLVVLSFMQKSGAMGYEAKFTLENYLMMADKTYMKTFLFSIRLSFITTIITVLIGYPFAYFMSRCKKDSTKAVLLLLVILPFWTNALVRIYGFIILFRGNGIVHNLLNLMGMGANYGVLYTKEAVVMGMVYGLLPFMILTAYSACSKLDSAVIEASRDLGAGRIRTFFSISLPLTAEGLLSGMTMVFIPSMGLFFISDLLGGGKVMIAGNLIKDRIMTAHNYPLGAAISVVMLLCMFACVEITKILVKKILK